MKKKAWNICAVCGRFIAYADFVGGKATNTLVTPESLVTHETFEALCARHKTEQGDGERP